MIPEEGPIKVVVYFDLRMMNKNGYTLVELMISLAILIIVLVGVGGVLQAGDAIFLKDTALLDMQQQTRGAINRIVREIRQASSQTITTNYNSTTNDKIVFTIPTAIGIKYYLNGTNLIREYPAGQTKNIASNVSLLKFSLIGSLLQIQIAANKTIYRQTISFPGGGSAPNWAASTPYVVGSYVANGGEVYSCLVAHTSGTFAADLAAGKWMLQAYTERVRLRNE